MPSAAAMDHKKARCRLSWPYDHQPTKIPNSGSAAHIAGSRASPKVMVTLSQERLNRDSMKGNV